LIRLLSPPPVGVAHSAQPTLHQGLTLTARTSRSTLVHPRSNGPVRITLNGEPHELDEPLSVADLLSQLSIDPRRVAIEHNLSILKRQLFADARIHDGDRIEIVNFVGGG
jgi:sulfur carrier protein